LGKNHKLDKSFKDWTNKNQNILAVTYEGDAETEFYRNPCFSFGDETWE